MKKWSVRDAEKEGAKKLLSKQPLQRREKDEAFRLTLRPVYADVENDLKNRLRNKGLDHAEG